MRPGNYFSLLVVTFLLIISTSSLSGQLFDNYWALGYGNGINADSNSIVLMHFGEGEMSFRVNDTLDFLWFNDYSGAYTNYSGEKLRFVTNGSSLIYPFGREVEGSRFAPEDDDYTQYKRQGLLFLPINAQGNQLRILRKEKHPDFIGIDLYDDEINESIINIEDHGFIELLKKASPLITNDTLNYDHMAACRHANGRDWWLLQPRLNSREMLTYLVRPDTIEYVTTQLVPDTIYSGLGSAFFSPNGNFYACLAAHGLPGTVHYFNFFEFDRCSGLLSNGRRLELGAGAFDNGGEFSPDSRYLYISNYNEIWQYDLARPDPLAEPEVVLVRDDYRIWNFWPVFFGHSQLAPDGKIYIASSTAVPFLHTIHFPDRAGAAAEAEQRAVPLPVYNSGQQLSYHPHYRLGPLDGSPCDTLGLDNEPRARFRIDREADSLSFHFQDLSYYEPTTWSWDFAGLGTSTARHPDFTFPGNGTYEVCLTVSNENAADTKCRTIQIGPVATDDPVAGPAVRLWPNPSSGWLTVDFGERFPQNASLTLFDGAGRQVLRTVLPGSQNPLSLRALPAGLYLYRVEESGRVVARGKLVLR
jgi:hypothetical protein